ncbi:MAG: hypothetical protein OXF75_08585, partial [Acidimicrobiaceae bacterium]|nr:hypothetical protein [Acidimicrobiaceae bacterium]
ERVLDHLLTDSEPRSAAAPPSQMSDSNTTTSQVHDIDATLASEQQRVDALAHYFKISPDDVLHIFQVSGEEPELVLPPSRLTNASAIATREISLLIAGARTALGQETTTAHIREVADHFGKLDSSNFSQTVTKMSELSVLGKPHSPNRAVRMRATGVEAARGLAQRIVGE